MTDMKSTLSERLADILRGTGTLTFSEQVACVAALEVFIRSHTREQMQELEAKYGTKAASVLKDEYLSLAKS